MASEYYKCKEELSLTDIEKGENEQIASETYFDAIHNILKREEVKEETPEIKPFSKYGKEENAGGNEFEAVHIRQGEIVKNVDSFYDPDLSVFEVTQRNGGADLKESTFSPIHSCLADKLAKPQVSHCNNGVIVKNENECSEDSSRNSVESKMETLKTECDIDIIYEDVKPQICEEKSRGKNENESYLNSNTDISIGTEVGPNKSIDPKTWLQQNIEEYGTAVKRANDTRKGSTLRINLINFQMIQKLPHNVYPKFDLSDNEKGYLAGHETIHTGKNPFQCKLCPKSFAFKSKLLCHERIHTGEKPFQCKICLKSFAAKRTLLSHERIHTGEKPYQCKICLKYFSQKGHMTEHERIHTGEKPFQCKVCPKSFSFKSSLLVHEIVHTGEKPFHCKICPKSFAFESRLLIHKRMHTGEKPFQCKSCSKSFSCKEYLTGHEIIHIGEKPFQCKICSKSFFQSVSLRRHERIHTGIKPFECKFCLKSYSHKGHLTEHERIHTGKKPFQCKFCLKSFSRKGVLTVHEKLHTGEKSFECKVCAKSFVSKSKLLTHNRIHTGEKPFQCKICLNSFAVKSSLLVHEKIHKGENHVHAKSVPSRLSYRELLRNTREFIRGKTISMRNLSKEFY